MATFTTAGAATTVSPFAPVGVLGVASYTLSLTANVTANDVYEMVRLPKGAKIVDVTLSSTDLDTNGTPTITMSVGYGGDDDYFIVASTIGQTGGVARMAAATTGTLLTLTAEDTIDLKFPAVAATFAAGTVTLTVFYMVSF